MTQKRAKENENPEPQTGRGHKLTDRLRNRQLGHEELPNRENATHRNDGHAPRADSPEGASGRPPARGAVPPPVASAVHATPGDPLRACLGACDGTCRWPPLPARVWRDWNAHGPRGGPEAGGAVCGSDIQAHGEGRPSHAWASPPERGPAARRPARGRAGSYSASPEPGGLRTCCRVGGRPGRTPVSGGLSSDTARP